MSDELEGANPQTGYWMLIAVASSLCIGAALTAFAVGFLDRESALIAVVLVWVISVGYGYLRHPGSPRNWSDQA